MTNVLPKEGVRTMNENGTPDNRFRDFERIDPAGYPYLFELSPDMICVTDASGIFLAMNPACRRILGFEPDEMVGISWEAFVHPDDLLPTRIEVANQLSGEKVLNFSNRYRTKDGWYRTLQWQGTAMKGRLIFGTARDITEQTLHGELLAKIADDERRNVCFALHDGIGQQLVGLRLLAGALERDLKIADPGLAARAEAISRVADEALAAVRNIMEGLTPLNGAPDALPQALAHLADRVGKLHHIPCRLQLDTGMEVAETGVANHLFLIAQEAVMNAVKHAAPKTIDISLSRQEEKLALVVSDNGKGIVLPQAHIGLGIAIMRDRAHLIGASFDVGRRPEGGTIVTCTLEQRPETTALARACPESLFEPRIDANRRE